MHDVAIVGYGPVGATLAGLLGRLGVDVVVFDKNHAIYTACSARIQWCLHGGKEHD